MMKRKKHLWIAVLIPAILLFFILRFTLFYIRSDGFSGLSMLLPILLLCFILFAIGMSASFAAWVYMDCKKRGDDPILWTLVIIIATPFIGLLNSQGTSKKIANPPDRSEDPTKYIADNDPTS